MGESRVDIPNKRPNLSKELDSEVFKKLYYLK